MNPSGESRKTIQINPDFLRFHRSEKTRKKRPEKAIQFKTPSSVDNTKTTKRKMLNYIRRQQEANYKRLVKPDPPQRTDPEPKTAFEESLAFLENVVRNPKNQTIKQRPTLLDENVQIFAPDHLFSMPAIETMVEPTVSSDPLLQLAKPQYGCLKGGKLPTFRNWVNQTQKNNPPPLTASENRAELRQFFQKKREEKNAMREAKRPVFQQTQKRTLRRTYRVGKSKVHPRVSVLVSNRTIRNQIQSHCQKLKETSIEDVRKYLVKTGLIRVGSTTPNDVLRKMYESAKLMCGDIQNHNAENLLYNYLNDG